MTRIALELASDVYPDLDTAYYLDAIDALAARAGERCPLHPRPEQILKQINWVLYVEEEYKGNADDYYDPRNSYLNQVIDRRSGIPITLVDPLSRGRRATGRDPARGELAGPLRVTGGSGGGTGIRRRVSRRGAARPRGLPRSCISRDGAVDRPDRRVGFGHAAPGRSWPACCAT